MIRLGNYYDNDKKHYKFLGIPEELASITSVLEILKVNNLDSYINKARFLGFEVIKLLNDDGKLYIVYNKNSDIDNSIKMQIVSNDELYIMNTSILTPFTISGYRFTSNNEYYPLKRLKLSGVVIDGAIADFFLSKVINILDIGSLSNIKVDSAPSLIGLANKFWSDDVISNALSKYTYTDGDITYNYLYTDPITPIGLINPVNKYNDLDIRHMEFEVFKKYNDFLISERNRIDPELADRNVYSANMTESKTSDMADVSTRLAIVKQSVVCTNANSSDSVTITGGGSVLNYTETNIDQVFIYNGWFNRDKIDITVKPYTHRKSNGKNDNTCNLIVIHFYGCIFNAKTINIDVEANTDMKTKISIVFTDCMFGISNNLHMGKTISNIAFNGSSGEIKQLEVKEDTMRDSYDAFVQDKLYIDAGDKNIALVINKTNLYKG